MIRIRSCTAVLMHTSCEVSFIYRLGVTSDLGGIANVDVKIGNDGDRILN
jgi:hypothetical protein